MPAFISPPPERLSGRRRLALAMAVLALACMPSMQACRGEAGGTARGTGAPVSVQAFTVEPTRLPRTLAAVAAFESPQTTHVSPEVGGKVAFLDVPEGREVAAGHLLARLDDDRARASLTVAGARHKNAKDKLERLRALRDSQVISPQELDDAIAELEAAEGELENARTALDKTFIRAPFAGVLGLREVSLGAYLDPGDGIVRLTQTRPLHLIFGVPQRRLSQLAVGQTVRGAVGNCGERFTGEISVVDPYVDPATRSVRAQAVVSNAEGRLRPGMSATVKVEVDAVADALLVPQEVIVRQGTRRLVFVIGADDVVSTHEVSLGEYFSDRVQITSGLEPGAVVVTSGHQKLRPGAKAEAQPYEPIDNPNLQLGSTGELADCDF